VLVLAASARADWIQTIGIGERPALLGGAVSARGSDPAAWYYNPAAAGDLAGALLGANARVLDSRALVFSDADGEHRTDHTLGDADVAVAPSIGVYLPVATLPGSQRIPLSDRVVLGLGFGAPFAITADWNDRGFHRYNSRNQSLFVLELAPTLAVRLSDRLSIGATLDWVAFHKLRIDAFLGDGFVGQAANFATGDVAPLTTIDGSDDGDLSLRTDDQSELGVGSFAPDFGSAGYTLGARYRALDWLSFGVAYREETPVVFEGDVLLRLDPGATFGALPVYSRSGYRLSLEMPRHLQGGFAWEIAQGLVTWSVDLQWTQWSAAKGLGDRARVKLTPGLLALPAIPGLLPNPAARAQPGDAVRALDLDYDMRDTVAVRTGVEWHALPSIDVLLGYAYDPSVVSNSHVDAISFSSDRHLPSAGIAYHWGGRDRRGMQIVAGFQAAVYESRRVGEGQSRNLGGLATYQDADGDFDTLAFTANRDPFAASRSDGRPITGAVEFSGFLWAAGVSIHGSF
jgi:long-chain fatty acid transport protein